MTYEGSGIVPTMPVGGYGAGGFGSGSWIGEIAALGLVFGGGRGFLGNQGYGAGAGVVAEAGEARFEGLSNQINGLQNQITNGTLSNSIAQSTITTNAAIDNLAGRVGDIGTALAAGNFTTLQSINGLGNQITAQNNQNALQQLNSFNQLNTATLQGFNEVGRDTATATNQIIAGQNAMMAQNAACCCEIKQAINHDGNETRALVNAINLQNIQGQLADAKSQIGTLNQTITQQAQINAQTNVILEHLRPFPVVS